VQCGAAHMRSKLANGILYTLLAFPLLPTAACVVDAVDLGDPTLAGRDFEAVPRSVSDDERAQRQKLMAARGGDLRSADGGDSFYIAIKKSALSERWFLSAYLQDIFPGAAAHGAIQTLGTRVVSFRIQNDKLFVFDVDDNHATSDAFDPTLIVDAFPIVDEREFRTGHGRDTYVVIDPAAGLNRFNLVSDSFAAEGGVEDPIPAEADRFEIELSFSQSFRALDDGATWQNVFTGYADGKLGKDPLDPNQFRASGTLGMSLRRYHESPQYREVAMAPRDSDPGHEFFFRGPNRPIPDSSQLESVAAHWRSTPACGRSSG